jgi:DUF438 domain-containing protein
MKNRETVRVVPGHPVNTYLNENDEIAALADLLVHLERERRSAQGPAAGFLARIGGVLGRLTGAEVHYRRKEEQLFPRLERRGLGGPIRAMRDAHDEVRALIDALRFLAEEGEEAAVLELLPPLTARLTRVACLENEVLFPLALGRLDATEWAAVRRAERGYGFAFAASGAN